MSTTGRSQNNPEELLRNDADRWNRLQEVVKTYRGEPGSLVTVLQKVQAVYGYLPTPVMRYLAEALQIKPARIYGVATFYTQFRLTPMGKHLILLCQGTACHVNGAERIRSALCEELRIEPGETTPDGMFSLAEVACLGCCSLAPVMMIDGRAYGPLTPSRALKILRETVSGDEEGVAEP